MEMVSAKNLSADKIKWINGKYSLFVLLIGKLKTTSHQCLRHSKGQRELQDKPRDERSEFNPAG